MEILWVLMALIMISFVLVPFMRRRRGMIEKVLAGTETEGELRWQRVQAFAGAASLELQQRPGGVSESPGGQWLRVWRAEQPKDAGGAAVHAEFLVQQAWRTA